MSSDVTPIDELSKIEKEAADELAKERADEAKRRIKSSLKKIADAERIWENLKLEHQALLRDLRTVA